MPARLPVIRVRTSIRVPVLRTPPPTPYLTSMAPTVLPEMVLLVTVTVPKMFSMPAPL